MLTKKSNKGSSQVKAIIAPNVQVQIHVLLQAIDEMKDKIIEVWADASIPTEIKNERLADMRDALRATEKHTLQLMEMAISNDDIVGAA